MKRARKSTTPSKKSILAVIDLRSDEVYWLEGANVKHRGTFKYLLVRICEGRYCSPGQTYKDTWDLFRKYITSMKDESGSEAAKKTIQALPNWDSDSILDFPKDEWDAWNQGTVDEVGDVFMKAFVIRK